MKMARTEGADAMPQQIGSVNDVVIASSEKKRLYTFRQKLALVSRERLLKVFDRLDKKSVGLPFTGTI